MTAVVLPGVPASVGEARHLARRELEGRKGADAAALVVSEFATNAIEHSRSGLPGGTFVVAVETGRNGVTIRVADQGPRPDGDGDARPADEHGRGLAIVAEVADMWGIETTDTGRVAWCLLGRGAGSAASNTGVPGHPGTRAHAPAREGAWT